MFIDKGFGTYDVFVLVQTKNVDKSFQKHFTGSENAFDDFDIKEGPLHLLGKIIISPITGTAKLIKNFAELFMREDVDDIEYIGKEETENSDTEQNENA